MKRFKKLLVYTGTDQPEDAINHAIALAIENNATLTFMEVVKAMPRALGLMKEIAQPKEIEDLVVEDHRRKLLDRISAYSDIAIPIDVVVSVGDPATEIIREVLRNDHDLVVKSADGFTGAGRFFGSIARSLLRLCPCAVLLLKPALHGEFDNVLAAIDVDATDQSHQSLNESIVELSTQIAKQDNAKLHLVAAWEFLMEKPLRRRAGDAEVDAALEAHDASVRQAAKELLSHHGGEGIQVDLRIERGSASTVIRDSVEKTAADLLVMGTVCRTGVAGFLIGNTAETVLSNVTCSVLALKPQGFVCPIDLDDESEQ
ncbi:universal stress protein [Stieleria varia]|uniref:Universal stress protein E n=1 Tax=Stieleria varia TaxID=2528005 RepID=A0A5C5ZKZ0_9BACT|nr:universal stress protein [Stieleria varia]TWT87786.1 Universal stress protein E [Stieleria varia]